MVSAEKRFKVAITSCGDKCNVLLALCALNKKSKLNNSGPIVFGNDKENENINEEIKVNQNYKYKDYMSIFPNRIDRLINYVYRVRILVSLLKYYVCDLIWTNLFYLTLESIFYFKNFFKD